MRNRWRIATVRDVPIYVTPSWAVIGLVYTYSYYLQLTEGRDRLESTPALWLSLLAIALFLGSILLHEAAHAAVARSLDLPVRGITLVAFGGETEARAWVRGPRAEFLVAAAGPATTLAVGVALLLASWTTEGHLARALSSLGRLQLLFAGFNSIPAFPVDGGRMLLAVVWGATGRRNTGFRVAGTAGRVVGFAAAATAVWQLQTGGQWWVLLFFLAMILLPANRAIGQRVRIREVLSRGRVADVMGPPPPAVPAGLTLSDALDRYLRPSADAEFPVLEDGRVIGIVSMATARAAGSRDPLQPVRAGTAPLSLVPTFSPDEPLDSVIDWLGGRVGLVLADGALVGAISGGDVERWLAPRVGARPSEAPGEEPPPRPDL
jgi:Zn-dependent protease